MTVKMLINIYCHIRKLLFPSSFVAYSWAFVIFFLPHRSQLLLLCAEDQNQTQTTRIDRKVTIINWIVRNNITKKKLPGGGAPAPNPRSTQLTPSHRWFSLSLPHHSQPHWFCPNFLHTTDARQHENYYRVGDGCKFHLWKCLDGGW